MDTKEPVNKINNELFADRNNRDCRDLLSEYVRHGDLHDFATHSEVFAVLNEVYSLTARSMANNGYIQKSQLEPLTLTPGTFYICTHAPIIFTADKKIVGSTNPLLMLKAISQCIQFSYDAAEGLAYYSTTNANCLVGNVVSDGPTAYMLCAQQIAGAGSIAYTDNIN